MSIRRIGALVAVLLFAACMGSTDSEPGVEGRDGPGELISAEELDAEVDGTVWRVRYRSTSVQGEPVEVTGLVARPSSPPPSGGYPVLSWAHGTTGIADGCAPSSEGAGTIPGLQAHLDAGFVVAATDYEGLGGDGIHPYLVSTSEARSVLDGARAAARLVPEAGDGLLVAGHSQGGHAALATATLAHEWAPELDLLGTVAIAPVADLTLVIPAMFTLPVASGFGVMVAAGWSAAYPDLDVGDVLGPDGLDLAQRADEDLCAGEIFAETSAADLGRLITAQPRDIEEWEDKVQENSIDPDDVQGPVLVVQGGEDRIVPAALTERFVEDLCAAGAEVVFERYDTADHSSVLAEGAVDIASWFAERLAGTTAETTCR